MNSPGRHCTGPTFATGFLPFWSACWRKARSPWASKKIVFSLKRNTKNFSLVEIMLHFDASRTSSVCFAMDTFFTPMRKKSLNSKRGKCGGDGWLFVTKRTIFF
jgi:hypothetical protein